MRLSLLQKLVLLAGFAMFAAAILDILQVIDPPNWVWIVVPITLGPISLMVLPSMAQLRRAERRGSKS